jgi:antitoxin VapB
MSEIAQRMMVEGKTAKLFQNGRSQAVRLPKEFRFEGSEVRIRKTAEGAVILEPLKRRRTHEEIDAFFAKMDEYNRTIGPFMPEGRNQPPMQERDWGEIE